MPRSKVDDFYQIKHFMERKGITEFFGYREMQKKKKTQKKKNVNIYFCFVHVYEQVYQRTLSRSLFQHHQAQRFTDKILSSLTFNSKLKFHKSFNLSQKTAHK